MLILALACKKTPDDTAAPEYEAPWPDWTFEHWVWEDESTQESATALVDGYLERDIDVGAIIIDSPWATGYNTFEWDTDRYPDPQGMIDDFHDKGVHVFVWVVPAINTDVEVYDEVAEKGWFMQDDESSGPEVIDWWKGEWSLIDYWNPEAVDWWHGQVDKTLAYDIDGWKCDGLDYGVVFAPYSPGAGRAVDRIEYSSAYYRDFHDYTREQLGDDRVNTSRPIDNYGADKGGDWFAFTPVDILWAGWVGDQDATFSGLQAALNNMRHSSEYGYATFGSDIGGYREDDTYPQGRGKELFLRWAQLGALSPVMENGGGGDHHPWAFDDETVAIYKRFVDLHMALLPYINEHGATAFHEGNSLMSFTSALTFEYLLGPDVFVAPMLEEGTSRSTTLPDGDWIYLFDGSAYSGAVTLEVPLDEFPVFVREGSDAASALQDAL